MVERPPRSREQRCWVSAEGNAQKLTAGGCLLLPTLLGDPSSAGPGQGGVIKGDHARKPRVVRDTPRVQPQGVSGGL